ncbi:MAG: thioredoxin [Clostridia bacterium]|nr:thioredoxin [Clostridia bacterium]
MVDYSKKIRIGLIVIVVLAVIAIGIFAILAQNKPVAETNSDLESAVYEVIWNGTDYEHVGIADFAAYMQETKEPILIDFWAEWCSPCRLSAPVIEEMAKTYDGRARIVKINTDYAGPIAQAFGVNGIPHFSVVKDSTVVDELTGYSEELGSILGGKLDTVLAG